MNNFENAEYPPKGEYGTSAGSVKQSKPNKPEKIDVKNHLNGCTKCNVGGYSRGVCLVLHGLYQYNKAIDEMDAYYKQFIKEYILDDISSAEVIFDYIMDAIEKRTTVEESANDLHKLIKERLRV